MRRRPERISARAHWKYTSPIWITITVRGDLPSTAKDWSSVGSSDTAIPFDGAGGATLEVADILRRHGAAFRAAHAGHLSLGQLKVMAAIKACRTAALGGHVEGCQDCGHRRIAFNSCRNRHCLKCQAAPARDWLAARKADLLPVDYFHVVFSLPAEAADVAAQNKAVVYDLLFRRLFLTRLVELHTTGKLRFFGKQAGLCDQTAFQRHLAPTRKKPWIVYAKPPFAGPAAVLAYLSRYTHRVAISNRRLLALDERGVTFRSKDYRREGPERYRTMTLPTDKSTPTTSARVAPI